jgi:hypothetical protein
MLINRSHIKKVLFIISYCHHYGKFAEEDTERAHIREMTVILYMILERQLHGNDLNCFNTFTARVLVTNLMAVPTNHTMLTAMMSLLTVQMKEIHPC